MKWNRFVVALMVLVPIMASAQQGRMPAATTSARYVVLAWNDLGMHCLNPTYDTAVILPPYNTVWAQVIQRGNPPTDRHHGTRRVLPDHE